MCSSIINLNEAIPELKESKHYTPKPNRDQFFNWFMNTYPLVPYLNDQIVLPNAEYIRNQYKPVPSIGNTRAIIKFYKMYKLLIKAVHIPNQDQELQHHKD